MTVYKLSALEAIGKIRFVFFLFSCELVQSEVRI